MCSGNTLVVYLFYTLSLGKLLRVKVKALASPVAPFEARRDFGRHRRIAGSTLEPVLPTHHGNIDGGQGNDLGYGKNAPDWLIRSQAPKGILSPKEKVQRLGGGGGFHAP